MERIIEDDIIRVLAEVNSVHVLLLETVRQSPVVYDDRDLFLRTEKISDDLQELSDLINNINI